MRVRRSLIVAAMVVATGCTYHARQDAGAAPSTAPRSSTPTDCGVGLNAKALADKPGFGLAPKYVGLTLGEAQSLARRSHLTVRVVGQDGHCPPVTADARKDRVSVYVVHDRIRAAAVY